MRSFSKKDRKKDKDSNSLDYMNRKSSSPPPPPLPVTIKIAPLESSLGNRESTIAPKKTSSLKNVNKLTSENRGKSSSSKSVTFRDAEIIIIASSKHNNLRERISFDIAILFIGHLLKYADKYAINGIMTDLMNHFNIDKYEMMAFRTICLASLMVASPIFGYLGDRMKRKHIVSVGIFACSALTYTSSFVPPTAFGIFILCHVLISIGEASYCVLVITMIADMFQGSMRTLAITLYSMAIPLGSGFGYTFAKKITSIAKTWKWSLRISPIFGFVCSTFIFWAMDEPKRGASDGKGNSKATPLIEDLKYIITHGTFITLTLGVSCVSFVLGAVAVWGPSYIYQSAKDFDPSLTLDRVTMTFELITCISGVGGVLCGYLISSFIGRFNKGADLMVCGFGMLLNGLLLFLALGIPRESIKLTWVFVFYSQMFIFSNFAIVSDILMCTVAPARRSLATSLQMFISHALGDVGSPYFLPMTSPISIYVKCAISVLGGLFFFSTLAFRKTDRKKVEDIMRKGSKRRVYSISDFPEMSPNGTGRETFELSSLGTIGAASNLDTIGTVGSNPNQTSGSISTYVTVSDGNKSNKKAVKKLFK